LWHTWRFIQPGLNDKEQRITKPLLVGAVFLFPLGAAFAFYMIKFVLQVMQIYAVQNIDPLLNIFQYLSLLSNMMLIFGIIFEIPLILAIGSRVGLVTPKFLQTYRRHAYVLLSIGAMVITPGGDPITMIVALLPLVALYELSIALSKPMARLHQRDLSDQTTEEPVS
jgi:sec-independent protein translocase protein TatC